MVHVARLIRFVFLLRLLSASVESRSICGLSCRLKFQMTRLCLLCSCLYADVAGKSRNLELGYTFASTGDSQDSQGVSAFQMSWIVSGGALNSTHSLTHSQLQPFTVTFVMYVSYSYSGHAVEMTIYWWWWWWWWLWIQKLVGGKVVGFFLSGNFFSGSY